MTSNLTELIVIIGFIIEKDPVELELPGLFDELIILKIVSNRSTYIKQSTKSLVPMLSINYRTISVGFMMGKAINALPISGQLLGYLEGAAGGVVGSTGGLMVLALFGSIVRIV